MCSGLLLIDKICSRRYCWNIAEILLQLAEIYPWRCLLLTTLQWSSRPEVFIGKAVLKICSKFAGEHPCRSLISIKLLATLLKSNFGTGVLLQICCIFSEQLFLWTPLDDCFTVTSLTVNTVMDKFLQVVAIFQQYFSNIFENIFCQWVVNQNTC